MLFIVSGPIGNLGDITIRAIETLKEVDLIAVEDTRRTGKLLKHFKITTPMESYHDFNKETKLPKLLELLRTERNVALFSDAGTPTISDPGYKLVKACLDEKIKVSPIPGPSAAISALSVSGQPTDKFAFLGFLPKQRGKRRKLLNQLRECQCVSSAILYESPYRLVRLLEELADIFGEETNVTVCNEMTKMFEKIDKGILRDLLREYKGKERVKGEFTVVLSLK
jgi:16S rRNA (cytidine1402-2'-O)-methyltransferase